MSFQYQLIDSSRFHKYKMIRYILYFMLILLTFLIVKIRKNYRISGQPNSLAQLFGIDSTMILFTLIIIGTVAYLLHNYSKSLKKTGIVKIDSQNIVIIRNGFKQIFEIKNIENLRIERGSTWHYSYKEDNYLVQIDNWIKFMSDNIYTEIEFSLLTAEENSKFEAMVINLKDKQVNFQYLSI